VYVGGLFSGKEEVVRIWSFYLMSGHVNATSPFSLNCLLRYYCYHFSLSPHHDKHGYRLYTTQNLSFNDNWLPDASYIRECYLAPLPIVLTDCSTQQLLSSKRPSLMTFDVKPGKYGLCPLLLFSRSINVKPRSILCGIQCVFSQFRDSTFFAQYRLLLPASYFDETSILVI